MDKFVRVILSMENVQNEFQVKRIPTKLLPVKHPNRKCIDREKVLKNSHSTGEVWVIYKAQGFLSHNIIFVSFISNLPWIFGFINGMGRVLWNHLSPLCIQIMLFWWRIVDLFTSFYMKIHKNLRCKGYVDKIKMM